MIIKFFSCCILTKGAKKNSIIDLQRHKIYAISSAFYNLIDPKHNSIDVGCLKKKIYDEASLKALNEFIEFLLSHELAFTIEKKELNRFPLLSKDWDYHGEITNCIYDFSAKNYDLFSRNFLIQIYSLGCRNIQLRIFKNEKRINIKYLMALLNESNIEAVELILPNSFFKTEKEVLLLINSSPFIKSMTLFSAPQNKILKYEDDNSGMIVLTTKEIHGKTHCGIVQLEQFPVNVYNFTESLHHNSCLNRKLSIDTEGNIKNCPSMAESYGNIRDTTLAEALEKPGFKKYWDINKDKIHVCKDCEFRYICTDCRAYVEDPEDILSKPLKCGYNPYTGEWSEWSTNPLKQKSIDFYGMREMVEGDGNQLK